MRQALFLLGLIAFTLVALLSIELVGRQRPRGSGRELAAIQRLREAGDYAAAADSARQLTRRLLASADAAPWQRADAARLAETCARAAAWPESTRAALAAADWVDSCFDSLIAAGRYRQAFGLTTMQLETRGRLLGPDHPETAASLVFLAETRRCRGDRAGSLELLQQSLELTRRALGEHHPAFAECEAALGRAEKQTWHLASAESLEVAALELRRDLFGEASRPVAQSLLDLADVQRSQGKYASALKGQRRALQILRGLHLKDDAEYVRALCEIGLVYCFQDDWRSAEKYVRTAVNADRVCSMSRIESRALSNSLLGAALFLRGDILEGRVYTLASLRDYEAMRGQGLPGYPPSIALTDWCVYALGQLSLGERGEAWISTERAVNRVLLDGLFPPDSSETPDEADWDLRERRRFSTLSEVQRHLASDAAIVGWLERNHNAARWTVYPFWAYVIRSSGSISWVKIEAPPGVAAGAQSQTMNLFTNSLYTMAEWPLRAPRSSAFDRLSRAAYAERITPILPYLKGVDRILFVNSGSTAGVPLEAFADSTGAYLGDQFVVSYIPSATFWVRMQERKHRKRAAKEWRALLVSESGFDSSRSAGALPAARAEVVEAGQLFSSPEVVTTESAATVNRLARSDSLRRFDLIHFATHLHFARRGAMRSALVLSAGAASSDQSASGGSPTARSGGVVQPEDILSSWHLDAALVTLSCCRADVSHGLVNDPTNGLSDALFRVGARAVLSPLCAVEDTATALLMRRFYENLTGSYPKVRSGGVGTPMSKARALQEAKRYVREYRAADGSQTFANPAYWASFQLLGDTDDASPATDLGGGAADSSGVNAADSP